MIFSGFHKLMLVAGVVSVLCSTQAGAVEVQIKMVNKGADGAVMAFEPALAHAAVGDTIHFIATDKGHNVESNKGMLPEGVADFTGKMNEDFSVKVEKEGVYGFNCKPHYVMGMVGLVVVGKPTNEAAVKAVAAASATPNLAKARFTKLLEKLDSGK